MAILKGKNPDKGSLQDLTSTTIDGGDDPDREALDVNVKNANDIEVGLDFPSGDDALATAANQTSGDQKTKWVDEEDNVLGGTTPAKVSVEGTVDVDIDPSDIVDITSLATETTLDNIYDAAKPGGVGISVGAYKSRYATLSWTDDIAAAGTKSATITAPAGYVVIPVSVYLSIAAVPASGTGNHYFEIYNSAGNANLGLLLRNTYNAAILYGYNEPLTTNTYYPNDKGAFIQVLQSLVIPAGDSLTIKYTNNTDALQTSNSTIIVRYIQIPQLD